MFVVGEVLPIGGVVPGVVLGVVPGVVAGVVPGVVLGVVPVVVEGMAAGPLGGQRLPVLEAVLGEVDGRVALGLAVDGLAVLIVDEFEGVVDVTGHGFVVDRVVVVAELGLVVCVPGVAAGAELDCVPGTTGVGVIAPVCGDCAIAIPIAKHSTRAVKIARVRIILSCWVLPVGMAAVGSPDAQNRKLLSRG